MKGVNFKNKKIEKRFMSIYDVYFSQLSKDEQYLYKVITQRYKKYSDNEYYVVFLFIYILIFFKKINDSDPIITDRDREKLVLMKLAYQYDIDGEKEKYLSLMVTLDPDMFDLKMAIKYTILVSEDKYIPLISNKENYYKSIWYIIPYLTIRENKFLWYFQDQYFKKIYPDAYNDTKQTYLSEVSKTELPGEYMIGIFNDISHVLEQADVMWQIKIRKKSYFSIYNKMNRKNYDQFSDSLWVRIIFERKIDLKKFIKQFEDSFMQIYKKDYISRPKENWYQSIHYRYLNFYRNNEILVELQIRTKKMDKQIHEVKDISHFNYTIKTNKWSEIFKEVLFWYKYVMEIIDDYQKGGK